MSECERCYGQGYIDTFEWQETYTSEGVTSYPIPCERPCPSGRPYKPNTKNAIEIALAALHKVTKESK